MGEALSIPATSSAPTELAAAPAWSLATRLLFRFFFVYWLLYCLPFPLDQTPFLDQALGFVQEGVPAAKEVIEPIRKGLGEWQQLLNTWGTERSWHPLAVAVGERVFGVAITVFTNGSGDTTYDYVRVFIIAVASVVLALLWSLLDWRRKSYPKLFGLLHVYLRYYLALIMLSYGFSKLIPLQMPAPSLDRLIQPFGDASPMGLLWTFIGASTTYESFTGLGEVIGGLLLTTRRTTLLGAMITFGVMLHVAVLNFAYDVPVKLMSSHLVLMSLFIMAPQAGRLVNFFILNRPAPAAPLRPWFQRRGLNHLVVALRTLLVLGLVALELAGAIEARQLYGSNSPRSPFRGIWQVEEFEVDGKVVPPDLREGNRWRRVIFDSPTYLAVQFVNDRRERFGLKLDPAKRTMTLQPWAQTPGKPSVLTYTRPQEGIMELSGDLLGKKIRANLKLVENPEFRLITRGFNWIQEYPFNR